MRFLFIGAGALGGYYGAALVRGGADVTFLVRPRRAAQLAERGLVVKTATGDFTVTAKTVRAGALDGPYDIVFLACKAYDLDAAIADFADGLAPDGAVLPVLNGINHIAVLTDRFGAGRVLGGITWFSAVLTAEGDIVLPGAGLMQTTFGELGGERSPRCEEIDAAFAAAGVPATLSQSILAEMWAKFSGMAATCAIAALMRARSGEVGLTPAAARVVAAAVDECAPVATAEGYPMPAMIKDVLVKMWGEPGPNYGPSMLTDIENGRPTEGEHIIGDFVRRADRHAIEVPILRAALCNLQIYEARRRAR
jgi:2-dehydropantoate 2-reductase